MARGARLAPPAGLEPATHGLGNCTGGPVGAPGGPRGRPPWQTLAKRVLAGPRRSCTRSYRREWMVVEVFLGTLPPVSKSSAGGPGRCLGKSARDQREDPCTPSGRRGRGVQLTACTSRPIYRSFLSLGIVESPTRGSRAESGGSNLHQSGDLRRRTQRPPPVMPGLLAMCDPPAAHCKGATVSPRKRTARN